MPPKNGKIFLVIGVFILLFLIWGFVFVYQFNSLGNTKLHFESIQNLFPIKLGGAGELDQSQSTSSQPTFKIEKVGKHLIHIYWYNLPKDTKYLNVFRKELTQIDWVRWQTIAISGNDITGSIQLQLTQKEDAGSYSFYVQAINFTNQSLWSSAPTVAVLPTPTTPGTSPSQTPATSPSTSPPPPSGNTSSPPTTTPPPPTGTTPPPLPSANSSPYLVYYYTPAVQPIITTSSIGQTGTFWAIHTNNYIEIGWQNLPPATDDIVIYRSLNIAGPWSKLLEEKNPDTVNTSTIRLLDITITDPYYYKMDAFQGNTLLGTYGPVFLESL